MAASLRRINIREPDARTALPFWRDGFASKGDDVPPLPGSENRYVFPA